MEGVLARLGHFLAYVAVREAEKKKTACEAEAQRLTLQFEGRKLEAEERRRELEFKVAQKQAEHDARLKTEQPKLEHEIRLVELKARQANSRDGEGVDGHTPSDPSGRVI